MCLSRVVLFAFVCALGAGPAAAPAQSPQPTTRPGNQSAEEVLKQMLQPQGETAQPLKPADGAAGSPTDVDDPETAPADTTSTSSASSSSTTGRPLVAEGTPLLDRVGRLTASPDGKQMLFTLEADGRTLAEPPMVLLPNRRLMQLEDRLRTSYRDLKISVSGEVTEYRGRNYLLLTRWQVVQETVQPLR
jgi:hypothetical protein